MEPAAQIFLEEKIVNDQRWCLEESGQRLEYVCWTCIVRASGKLVLQKSIYEVVLCCKEKTAHTCSKLAGI